MPKETTKAKRKTAEKSEKAPRKTKKDPKAPKRALSAYMFFSSDWRERIRAENPEAGFGEIGKLLGAKWKELDEEEKKPYVEQAAKDKERAEEEKTAYDNKKNSAGSGGSGAEEAANDEEDDDWTIAAAPYNTNNDISRLFSLLMSAVSIQFARLRLSFTPTIT